MTSPAADLLSLARPTLLAMAEAGREMREWERILDKTGDSVVTEITARASHFVDWEHYPPGDVYDPEHHAQYYFHLHPAAERAGGELGHFHTFLRGPALSGEESLDIVCHLVAIGVDRRGRAARLFTTNRWVTDETWRDTADIRRVLDGFTIGHARPSWPVNRWVGAALRLFRPQIVTLLAERDHAVAAWTASHPGTATLEDRDLEITSERAISVEAQIAAVDHALALAHGR